MPPDDAPTEHATFQPAIHDDVICVACGYNLRGLSIVGGCSECGTAIAESLRGDHLFHSDRHWLRGMIAATRWASAASATIMIMLTIGIVLLIGGTANMPLSTLLSIVPLTLGLISVIRFTTPEPSRLGVEDNEFARKAARAAGVALLAVLFANVMAAHHWPKFGDMVFAANALAAMCVVSIAAYATRLARRLPHAELVGKVQFMRGFWLINIAVATLLQWEPPLGFVFIGLFFFTFAFYIALTLTGLLCDRFAIAMRQVIDMDKRPTEPAVHSGTYDDANG